MTREEAKAILENDIMDGHVEGNARFMDAFWMAVDALSQEPCEDAISREAVQKAINCWIGSGEYRYAMSERFLIDRINDLPSVTQKSGKWIITPFSVIGRHYQCSECKYIHTFANFEYCPKCGAKMVEPQEFSQG